VRYGEPVAVDFEVGRFAVAPNVSTLLRLTTRDLIEKELSSLGGQEQGFKGTGHYRALREAWICLRHRWHINNDFPLPRKGRELSRENKCRDVMQEIRQKPSADVEQVKPHLPPHLTPTCGTTLASFSAL
jgi:hypothetical protein